MNEVKDEDAAHGYGQQSLLGNDIEIPLQENGDESQYDIKTSDECSYALEDAFMEEVLYS